MRGIVLEIYEMVVIIVTIRSCVYESIMKMCARLNPSVKLVDISIFAKRAFLRWSRSREATMHLVSEFAFFFFFEISPRVLSNTQLVIVSARRMLAGELIDRARHICLAHRSIFISSAAPSNQRDGLRAPCQKRRRDPFSFSSRLPQPALVAARRRYSGDREKKNNLGRCLAERARTGAGYLFARHQVD